MARVVLEGERLVVEVEGLARMLTPRGRVEVALAHVTQVEARAEPQRSWVDHLKTLTGAGTHIPGMAQVGTFATADGLVYYALRDGRRAVVIELEGERLCRLIVEPGGGEAPEALAQRISMAAARARGQA